LRQAVVNSQRLLIFLSRVVHLVLVFIKNPKVIERDRYVRKIGFRIFMPGCPKLYFGVVDVRDVADIHLRAMTDPAAKGERFLATASDFMSMADIAKVLKSRLGLAAKRVPTRELPNWLVRIAALPDPAIRLILPELGKYKNATNEKAKRVLAWRPRSNEEAILATAESLIRLGLLKG